MTSVGITDAVPVDLIVADSKSSTVVVKTETFPVTPLTVKETASAEPVSVVPFGLTIVALAQQMRFL